MDKNELYERAKALFNEVVTLEQDVEALLAEFTYDEEDNPKGLDKKEVKAIAKAAEIYVRNNVEKVEDKIAREQEFLELYRELSGEY
jgi:hypothetical protein